MGAGRQGSGVHPRVGREDCMMVFAEYALFGKSIEVRHLIESYVIRTQAIKNDDERRITCRISFARGRQRRRSSELCGQAEGEAKIADRSQSQSRGTEERLKSVSDDIRAHHFLRQPSTAIKLEGHHMQKRIESRRAGRNGEKKKRILTQSRKDAKGERKILPELRRTTDWE